MLKAALLVACVVEVGIGLSAELGEAGRESVDVGRFLRMALGAGWGAALRVTIFLGMVGGVDSLSLSTTIGDLVVAPICSPA